MFTANTPYTKCLVRKEFLRDGKDGHGQFENGYIFAVTSIPNKPLLFHVHLESGAIISRLPIHALAHKKSRARSLETLELWSALSDKIQVIEYDYLKNYSVLILKTKEKGRYRFTIDTCGQGFAEHPDQYKCYHFIELSSGYFALMPNNAVLFPDGHFTKDLPLDYFTNTREFSCEENKSEAFYEVQKEDPSAGILHSVSKRKTRNNRKRSKRKT